MPRMYAEDLTPPVLINHHGRIGDFSFRQIKRVDEVVFDATTHPDVLKTLGVDPDRPIVMLRGDTVDADGKPVGAVRGWRTYVNADDHIDVL